MKHLVVYHSKTGNTKKVAGVIADVLRTKAQDAGKVKSVPKGSLLVVGSGVYAGRTGRSMMDFLQGLPGVKGGKAATFETSGDGGKVVAGKEMGAVLRKRGYAVKDSFVCPGSMFKIFRRGYPTSEDLERAGKFADSLRKL